MKVVRKYAVIPTDGRKSFYDKAIVDVYEDGSEVLKSYGTEIVKRTKEGKLIRLYKGWTSTTGRHIKAFCGLDKKGFDKLPCEG